MYCMLRRMHGGCRGVLEVLCQSEMACGGHGLGRGPRCVGNTQVGPGRSNETWEEALL